MTGSQPRWSTARTGSLFGDSLPLRADLSPWLLVFDLDGTLIDSSLDLCHSVNAALAHVGKHALPEDSVARFIGDGAAMLVRRALMASEDLQPRATHFTSDSLFDEAFPFFLSHYREHKLDNTYVYPGVMDSLQQIRERHPHLPMAVLTNKPVNPSREICSALGLAPFFFANYGGNSFSTKKPEPEGLRTLISEAHALVGATMNSERFNPSGVIMVGDSDVDVLTARACGARSLGCRYGLAPEALAAAAPDWMVDSPSEWPSVLGL